MMHTPYTEGELRRSYLSPLTNFEKWAKDPVWNTRYVGMILAGVDPESLSNSRYGCDLDKVQQYDGWLSKCIDFGKPYKFNIPLHGCHHGMNGSSYDLDPLEVLEWAQLMEIQAPPNLEAQTLAFWQKQSKPRGTVELQKRVTELEAEVERLKGEITLNPKTRTALLHILYAMASEKRFGYVHGQNNSAASNIESALDSVNLKVSQKTIRDWLSEAGNVAIESGAKQNGK